MYAEFIGHWPALKTIFPALLKILAQTVAYAIGSSVCASFSMIIRWKLIFLVALNICSWPLPSTTTKLVGVIVRAWIFMPCQSVVASTCEATGLMPLTDGTSEATAEPPPDMFMLAMAEELVVLCVGVVDAAFLSAAAQ